MRCYILFENHTQGLHAHRLLDDADIPNRITSTPRVDGLKVPCGMCLLVPEDAIDAAEHLLQAEQARHGGILKLAENADPLRDRFC